MWEFQVNGSVVTCRGRFCWSQEGSRLTGLAKFFLGTDFQHENQSSGIISFGNSDWEMYAKIGQTISPSNNHIATAMALLPMQLGVSLTFILHHLQSVVKPRQLLTGIPRPLNENRSYTLQSMLIESYGVGSNSQNNSPEQCSFITEVLSCPESNEKLLWKATEAFWPAFTLLDRNKLLFSLEQWTSASLLFISVFQSPVATWRRALRCTDGQESGGVGNQMWRKR